MLCVTTMCLPKCGRPDGPKYYNITFCLRSLALKFSYLSRPRKTKVESVLAHDVLCHAVHNFSGTTSPINSYLPCIDKDKAYEFSKQPHTNSLDELPACDRQLNARREKSRIAAKNRRQRENLALVKLRLTLPIQPYRSPELVTRKVNNVHRSRAAPTSTSHTTSPVDTCALYAVSNYRAANTVSRQQQLAAPEFEKAVTVRLAGSALCLYNWLYPEHLHCDSERYVLVSKNNPPWCHTAVSWGGSFNSPNEVFHAMFSLDDAIHNVGPDFRAVVANEFGPQPPSTSTASISLTSKSLVLLIVDVVENTVVFAPPSYSRLIGLPWNSIIGLQSSELRSRQCAVLSSSNQLPGQWSAKSGTSKSITSCTSTSSRSPSPCSNASLISHQSTERRVSTPIVGPATSPTLLRARHCSANALVPRPAAFLWPVAPSGRSIPLTSLIPADPVLTTHCLTGDDVSGGDVSDRPLLSDALVGLKQDLCPMESINAYAVCWANLILPQRSLDICDARTVFRCEETPSSLSRPSAASTYIDCPTSDSFETMSNGTLRMFLLNPVPLFPSISVLTGASDQLDSSATQNPLCLLETNNQNSTANVLVGSYADLASTPQSYHFPDTLNFVDAQSSFLTALGWTQSDLVGCTLLDLIHPDDLLSVSDALSSVTESQPVVTPIHRLLSGASTYRWSRMLCFMLKRSIDGLWADSKSTVSPNFRCSSGLDAFHSDVRPSVDHDSFLRSSLPKNDLAKTTLPHNMLASTTTDHNAHTSPSCYSPAGASTKKWVLVCCHQFAQLSDLSAHTTRKKWSVVRQSAANGVRSTIAAQASQSQSDEGCAASTWSSNLQPSQVLTDSSAEDCTTVECRLRTSVRSSTNLKRLLTRADSGFNMAVPRQHTLICTHTGVTTIHGAVTSCRSRISRTDSHQPETAYGDFPNTNQTDLLFTLDGLPTGLSDAAEESTMDTDIGELTDLSSVNYDYSVSANTPAQCDSKTNSILFNGLPSINAKSKAVSEKDKDISKLEMEELWNLSECHRYESMTNLDWVKQAPSIDPETSCLNMCSTFSQFYGANCLANDFGAEAGDVQVACSTSDLSIDSSFSAIPENNLEDCIKLSVPCYPLTSTATTRPWEECTNQLLPQAEVICVNRPSSCGPYEEEEVEDVDSGFGTVDHAYKLLDWSSNQPRTSVYLGVPASTVSWDFDGRLRAIAPQSSPLPPPLIGPHCSLTPSPSTSITASPAHTTACWSSGGDSRITAAVYTVDSAHHSNHYAPAFLAMHNGVEACSMSS
ncbi:uncharacterized protein DEA37_0011616 [Paragonimus westermani]|uniref:PAS domain-containing protein n=1 Tax=Paragonimus westermani TaxID=34504 RepID=A0A5J4P3V1_9TREM|nr:uncharacterized protein DEA37_0011616 [Paragonimus westermani]